MRLRKFRLYLVTLSALVALALSLVATSAAAASRSSVDAGIKTRSLSFSCLAISTNYKLQSMEFVRDVREQSETVAPSSATPDVTDYIQYWYFKGCGSALDTYVRARVSGYAYDWYRDVVDYLGLG